MHWLRLSKDSPCRRKDPPPRNHCTIPIRCRAYRRDPICWVHSCPRSPYRFWRSTCACRSLRSFHRLPPDCRRYTKPVPAGWSILKRLIFWCHCSRNLRQFRHDRHIPTPPRSEARTLFRSLSAKSRRSNSRWARQDNRMS